MNQHVTKLAFLIDTPSIPVHVCWSKGLCGCFMGTWCYLVYWPWKIGSVLARGMRQGGESKWVGTKVCGSYCAEWAISHICMKKALHTICYPLNQNKMHSLSPLLVPGSESRPNSHSSGSTSWSGLEISSLSRVPFVVIERVSSEFLTSSLTYSSDSVWRNCHYSSVR